MRTNFLDKIVFFCYSILNSGMDTHKGHEEIKNVQRLIIFIMFGLSLNFVASIQSLAHGLYISLSLNITSILLLVVAYFLNKDGNLKFAKILGIITINLYLFAISYAEGLKAGEHLYYFPFLLALIFVIDLRNNHDELIITAIITFATAALIFIVAPFVSDLQVITQEQYSALFSSNLSLALVMTAIFTYYALKTLERNEAKILNEKRFKDTVYDTSLDGAFIVDPFSMVITDCNTRSIEIFGFNYKKEVLGLQVGDVLGPNMEKQIREQAQQEARLRTPWYGNVDFSRRDDTPFFGYVNIVPFTHGVYHYCKISILDITEIKIAEFEILKAKEKAEKAAQIKSRFLSNMSHELRTPLNAIIGTTNLILQEEYLPSQHQSFEVLKYSSEHMMHLVNDILDFSKIEAGKMELENAPFHLKSFLQKVIASFASPVAAKNIELKYSIDSNTDVEIIGDEMRLNQVLNNLMANAIKFTEKGEIKLDVKSVDVGNNLTEIYFSIADTGIGISKDKLRQIFESFTQADIETTRKFGGTGLGLSISRRIIEQMGGKLQVQSELNSGSQFYFSLKFSTTPYRPKFTEQNNGALPSLDGVTVLLAEDNPINMIVAKKFLQKWDINIIEAVNGAKAVELFYEKKPDVLLIDLEMPEMDGTQAVEEIRKTHPTIPIIAFTAATYENIQEDLLMKGFNDYIPKPFKPEELHKKIQYYINTVVKKSAS